LGPIIGAGWLFGALYASSLARPAAVISWLLGGGALMLLALTHAELGGMYPEAGAPGLVLQPSILEQPDACGGSDFPTSPPGLRARPLRREVVILWVEWSTATRPRGT
jgi:hypothetical protein